MGSKNLQTSVSESPKQGLTAKEAEKRLTKFGLNELPEKPLPSNLSILISQLKNPLVYVLIAAGLVTLVLNHIPDTILIFGSVLVNTALGFIQERRADKALYALKKLLHPKARVIRGNKMLTIDSLKIVPGDLVMIGQGDKIPADGKIIFANRLYVNESVLTGESVPVGKNEGEEGFMGTMVTSGLGRLLVQTTGAKTKMGEIALSLQGKEDNTPLKRQLLIFSKQLSVLVFGLIVFVFLAGLLSGKGILEMLTTSVALAVSTIPEGLLVAMTVVLAIGMQRILKKKGLVRDLVSAETLGGVTTICVDKTGTLTEGKMRVVDLVGKRNEIALQVVLANDLDDPIVIAAYDWAKRADHIEISLSDHKRLDSLPFSAKERFFASLNKWDKDHNMIFINGAPDYLLNWTSLSTKRKATIYKQVNKMATKGMRLMGLGRKKVSASKKKLSVKDVRSGVEWIGILAFNDPVRTGVKEALEKTKRAGIKPVVITGDYSRTALYVMKELGFNIPAGEVVLGSELDKMNTTLLRKKLLGTRSISLFARTTPDQKYKIIETLKESGEVVAMTGDGVNDAPALKKADIGIVVGEASDVAKESADLVLLDSSFATIVAAVEEGRGTFDNIRKVILYLMSDAFEEIIAVVGAIILGAFFLPGLPLPVTAAQILWVNIISDGFPDLALTVDPKVGGIMDRPPRPPQEKIVSSWMKLLIFIVSTTGGLVALTLYVYYYRLTGDLILSRSITFAALGVNSLVYVFSVRTLREPFWRENPFDNRWLNAAVFIGLVFQVLPFLFSGLGDLLGLTPLTTIHWLVVFAASLLMFIIIELSKSVFRISKDWLT